MIRFYGCNTDVTPNEVPTEPGWYWMRRKNPGRLDEAPRVIHVREYAGRLAWDNNPFDDNWEHTCEWAGPLPEAWT